MRRATSAWVAEPMPSSRPTLSQVAVAPMPTAAREAASRRPTMAVSTRFWTVCDSMPSTMGAESVTMRRSRRRSRRKGESMSAQC